MSTTVRVIPRTPQAPKNEGAIRVLEEALKAAKENENTSNLMLLMKVGDDYLRYSTALDDPMAVVAQLELGKHDVILQMAGLVDGPNSKE